MKPLILLTGGTGAAANGTPTWALNQNYAENIRRAGGIPILAVNNDCAEEYADLADGLLLRNSNARIYRIHWHFCCLYVSYSSIFIPIQHSSRLI